jgi:hypothetical protein
MPNGDFWPADLQGWLFALGQVAVAAGAAWKLAMVQVDQRVKEAEQRVVKQINGLGGRVKQTEMDVAIVEGRYTSMEADVRVLRDRAELDMRGISEKLGRLDERSRMGGRDAWGGKNAP